MMAALRGLTVRGRSFLAAGVAAALAAVILGEKDLMRVAVLLLVLPLLAVLYVGRGRHRLESTRAVHPSRLPVGGTARVELQLINGSRLPTGTLLLDDDLPYSLGSHPRVVLERLAAGHTSAVAYTLRPSLRGRYLIGPLTARLTDPFGLCELTRRFSNEEQLTVLPAVIPLPAIALAGEYTGSGDSRARSVAVHGDDDIAAREYRHGDDLRRVHWRSTARAGELMVRREEQPWESRATVLLDTRAVAHCGDGPDSSFEWAVSAAASVTAHLRRTGHRARLVAVAPIDAVHRRAAPIIDLEAASASDEAAVLDQLADIRTQRHADTASLINQVRRSSHGGLMVAVLGALDHSEADALARLKTVGTTCIALVIDPMRWLSGAVADGLHQRHTEAVGLLRSAGWRVVEVGRGDQLASLWPAVGRMPSGPATVAASGGRP